jgi:uncharacterized membrane protein
MIGFIVSIIATYYKYKMWIDPFYKTKNCNCGESNQSTIINGILTVLAHKKGSMLFNIPNSVFGILFYGLMFGIHLNDATEVIDFVLVNVNAYQTIQCLVNILFVLSFIGSIYLWIIMIYQIRSICSLCMTIYAINFLNMISAINFFINILD